MTVDYESLGTELLKLSFSLKYKAFFFPMMCHFTLSRLKGPCIAAPSMWFPSCALAFPPDFDQDRIFWAVIGVDGVLS